MTHKIYIAKVKTGKRGFLYDVTYEGETICQSSMTPLLDAARTMRERGLDGDLEMWDAIRPYPRMRSTIAGAAKLAVVDTGSGPRFAKYRARVAGEAQDGDGDDEGCEVA